jgi:integrase/recombinase XerD
LAALYKFASERSGLPNPVKKITKPKFKSREPDTLSKDQARKLLDAIQDEREHGLVYLYLGQAFRLSEALRLNIGDIRDDTIMVHGKEWDEPMPLLVEVRDILLMLLDGRSHDDPVFRGQRGRLGRDMVQYSIKELFKRAGINGVRQSPHTLRHTFGTLATIAGCDTYSVARLIYASPNHPKE